eukprot:362452-Chlamydomonas_euryale.AAC.7
MIFEAAAPRLEEKGFRASSGNGISVDIPACDFPAAATLASLVQPTLNNSQLASCHQMMFYATDGRPIIMYRPRTRACPSLEI